jgi:hypothetical protein
LKPNLNPEKIEFFNLFDKLNISNDILLDLAFDTKLIRHKRTINPADLLFALCHESAQGTVSHNDLAARLESASGISVSKVSVWKKINEQCMLFLKRVFELVIHNKFAINSPNQKTLSFDRIVVQDSTIIRLPQRLFGDFSGVANGHSKVCNARIQGVYDLVAEQFLFFSVDSYSKVDYHAAPELVLKKRDLTLRDRGYLIADEIQRHIDQGADCIYRHKYKLALFDIENGKPLELLILLKKTSVDMVVKLNNKAKTIVRLIALPVSGEIAENRRRKAKKELKGTPTADYLELLGWSIYLTTIEKETADPEKIFGLYKLRWRIEVIFKSWKSNMAFDRVHNVSKIQLWVILWSRFIMIIICTQIIYTRCRIIIKAVLNKDLSLIKVTHYLIRHPQKITGILEELQNDPNELGQALTIMAKYCSYEKRKKRTNYQEDLRIIYS